MTYSKTLLFALLILPVFLFSPDFSAAQPDNARADKSSISPEENSVTVRFNEFNALVRDGRIRRNDAILQMAPLLRELQSEYSRRGGRNYPRNEWVFPLAGYDERAITGGRNKGYIASGYDYFTGNRHGGHPSFDIFIRDRNQDTIDDCSGEQVKVQSLTGGIVVAVADKWERGSKLRGGVYLWIYDPANNLLVYYAHNSKLYVGLGEIVKPGDVLATVGRSGLNAYKRRSPTHLHLTVLEIKDGRPLPVNVYRDLVSSRKM